MLRHDDLGPVLRDGDEVARVHLLSSAEAAEPHRRRVHAWITAEVGELTRLCPWCGSVEHGRPRVAGGAISLAHAGGLSLVALAQQPVGVDLERAGSEEALGLDRDTWVRTEAALKVTGEGLRRAPEEVDLGAFWFADLDRIEGFVAALALRL